MVKQEEAGAGLSNPWSNNGPTTVGTTTLALVGLVKCWGEDF